MALSEFENKRVEKVMSNYLTAHRPPEDIRSEIDLDYKFTNQTVEIIELIKDWNHNIFHEVPLAKATYVKSKRYWKIFFSNDSGKWSTHRPMPAVKLLEDFLKIVDQSELDIIQDTIKQ